MWLFDKDKGDVAKDSSSKGNDGTIVGKAKRIEGKFGSALEFGGDAHVHAGKLVLPKNQITMVLWVSINTVQTELDCTIIRRHRAKQVSINKGQK